MSEMLDIDWFMQHRHAEIPAFLLHMRPTENFPAPGSPEFVEGLQAHFMYWLKLEEEGKLIGAGPVDGGGGLAIVLADDAADAEALAANEPMTVRGFSTCEVQGWSLNEGHAVKLAQSLIDGRSK